MRPFRLSLPALRRAAARVTLAVLAAACSDSSGPPDGPQPPGQIQVRTQPSGARVGEKLVTQPVVALLDCWDRLVDTTGVVVTASVVSPAGSQILSGAQATTVNGVAEFKDLVIVARNNAPVVLRFSIRHRSGVGTTIRDATPLTLEAGTPVAVQAVGQTTYTGAVGTAVTPAPSVTVLDAGQNPLPGVRVTFAVIEGAGRLTDSVATTDANGIARVGSWTLGLAGRNRVAGKINDTTQAVFTASATSQIGMLRINVAGRPDNEPVSVRVLRTTVGSPAFDSTVKVRDTLTLTGIPFGTYQVIGDSVNRGTRIYLPRANFGNLAVSETSGPEVKLQYAEYGRLEVTVRGLPVPNANVPLSVLQQDTTNGLQGTIAARNDAVVRALLPLGRFEVVAPTLGISGQEYAPNPNRQIITVRAGETSPVSVNYAVATGSLVVTVNGLPAGVTASIDITGPNGFRETVFMSGTRTYTGLVSGTYTVTAANTTNGTQTLRPDQTPKSAEVTAGTSATVAFTYAP